MQRETERRIESRRRQIGRGCQPGQWRALGTSVRDILFVAWSACLVVKLLVDFGVAGECGGFESEDDSDEGLGAVDGALENSGKV